MTVAAGRGGAKERHLLDLASLIASSYSYFSSLSSFFLLMQASAGCIWRRFTAHLQVLVYNAFSREVEIKCYYGDIRGLARRPRLMAYCGRGSANLRGLHVNLNTSTCEGQEPRETPGLHKTLELCVFKAHCGSVLWVEGHQESQRRRSGRRIRSAT